MVNFFWKFLTNIGTNYYYKREPKVSLYLFSAMHQTMIDTIAELSENNYEQAMDTLIELVRPLSEEILSSILFETKVLGIEWKNMIKKFIKPEDYALLLDYTLKSIWGKKWIKEMYIPTQYVTAAESDVGVDTYIIRMKSCPFCYPSTIPPERFGAHRFGKLLTLTIEQMSQLVQDFVGNDVEVVARETRCFHHGDPYGEIRVWFYPRSQPHLKNNNPYLTKIK
ncbi:MAG: hypothetical protein ACTSRS_11170 [Candidatus Helarchaeota archaeon]